MRKNILLTIEYDGTDFHGWQKQPHAETVQGVLEKAVSFIFRQDIQLNGASRTDAGVHAYGQRASFIGDIRIPTEKIASVINNALKTGNYGKKAANAVKIIKTGEVPLDFHARFNTRGKKYIYRIMNCDDMAVFKSNYFYHVKQELDIDAMRQAAEYIVGTHDFACFHKAGGKEYETTVRTVCSLKVIENHMSEGRKIDIEIAGDGFLYNMVRIITGTLVEAGLGKIEPNRIAYIIESGNRCNAGHTAPPQGLYLADVYY